MSMTAAALSSTDSSRRFYIVVAVLLLAVNLIGFAPSYFLMNQFAAPSLPTRTHIHGPIFVGWFLMFLVQPAQLADIPGTALVRPAGFLPRRWSSQDWS